MKTIDLVSIATLLIITSSINVSSYSFAAPLAQPSSILKTNLQNRSSKAVLGHISTRNQILVIKVDGFYSVEDKGGKILAEDITLDELKDRFPTLHKVLETGLFRRWADKQHTSSL